MSDRLSVEECWALFNELGYFSPPDDEAYFATTGKIRAPKAFVAYAEGLDQVMIVHLRRWLIEYQGMPSKDVDTAIEFVLSRRTDD